MEIIWQPNPLRTIIVLNESEKRQLWLNVKVERLQDTILSAWVALDIKDPEAADGARKRAMGILDPEYVHGEVARHGMLFDERLGSLFTHHLDALGDEHWGDCICEPSSCFKCRAESLLGIDTIEGLGKHEASAIRGAFRSELPPRSLDEAIAQLRMPRDWAKPDSWFGSEESFQVHVPRWKAERQRAYEWLLNYKATKLSGNQ